MITAGQARAYFDYNPGTGMLLWKSRPLSIFASPAAGKSWNTRHAGKAAGSVFKQKGKYTGYRHVRVCGRNYRVHYIVWLIYHGRAPEGVIDHVDGDGTNNKIANLRDATWSENSKNARISLRNTSGICGVRYYPPTRKWAANITSDGERVFLGYHSTIFEAACVRRSAEMGMGFTDRHGM